MTGVAVDTPVDAREKFTRVSTYSVYRNLPARTDRRMETLAEIIAASSDGMTLLYTNAARSVIGLVDIRNPGNPKPAGRIPVGGEPTSVAVRGGYAYAAVNTSASYTLPSGHLAVIDLTKKSIIAKCDVRGQPDSVAISPKGDWIAIAVENQRDPDRNGGRIPQRPAGFLASFQLGKSATPVNCTAVRRTDLTGLARIAPSDPEPEYVAINKAGLAVVTLQENNHIVIVDMATGTLLNDFSAGTSTVSQIDATKDKTISLTDSKVNVVREPDTVAWLDNRRFVIANEGDYRGGTRGFTVFSRQGEMLFDSGAATEHLAVSIGHYPEKRSHRKGTEPEGIAVGTFNGRRLVFVGLERANAVAVYEDRPAKSVSNSRMDFLQVLPSGARPEGILAIPSRGLFVVAAEADKAKKGVRSTISIYALGAEGAIYPHIVSVAGAGGAPIGWGALSGLSAHPSNPSILYAVNDGSYGTADIFTIDVSATPARITGSRRVTENGKPMKHLDLEGIATAADGSHWLVSEGRRRKKRKKERPSLLLHVGADGALIEKIRLPKALDAKKRNAGLEGVALGRGKVIIAVQRAWKGDPRGHSKILVYTPATKAWGVMHYRRDAPESPSGGWVGLSEITALGSGRFAVIERDNRSGPDAAVKRIYTIDTAGVKTVAPGGAPRVVKKTLALDLLPKLRAFKGWVPGKPEGLAVAADGQVYAVTDNDGVGWTTGETLFLRLGKRDTVFK